MVGKSLRRALISTGEWETILCNILIVLFSYLLSALKYTKQYLSWYPPYSEKTISSKKSTLFLNKLQTHILIRDSLLPNKLQGYCRLCTYSIDFKWRPRFIQPTQNLALNIVRGLWPESGEIKPAPFYSGQDWIKGISQQTT